VSQAGLINNLNDGVVWGLVPVVAAAAGLKLTQIGIIAAVYPAVWGLGQLFTGGLSDIWGRKWLIVAGLWIQAIGIGLFALTSGFNIWLVAGVFMGFGTAMAYPTLLAAISDVAHPSWRSTSVGVYRLWRDGGFVVGGLTAGLLADAFSIMVAIGVVGLLTLSSGILVAVVMRETLSSKQG